MKANSLSRTGYTMLPAGDYYLLTDRNCVKLTHVSYPFQARSGVHPRTQETVYHPVVNGKVQYECTLFNAWFKPERYPSMIEVPPYQVSGGGK